MNRLSVYADVSGRVTRSTLDGALSFAGAVALESLAADSIAQEMHGLPKWGRCSYEHAEHVVDVLASQALSAAIVRVNRDTDHWRLFVEEAQLLGRAIERQSRAVASWAKPTNLLKFILLGSGCAVATGHALFADKRPRILNARGHQMIECSNVCDSDIQGSDSLEVFKACWSEQRLPRSRLAAKGIDMIARDIAVRSEQEEPNLLLADYLAGLGRAALPTERGRSPLAPDKARRLLGILRQRGKLVTVEEDFSRTHQEIYGELMDRAREFADK